jgi:hypothetical protein
MVCESEQPVQASIVAEDSGALAPTTRMRVLLWKDVCGTAGLQAGGGSQGGR